MTTDELVRIARDVVPPVGATGWRITVFETRPATVYAVVPILFARVDGVPVFRGSQGDCVRFYDLLDGRAPTLRSAPRSVAGAPAALAGPAERGAVRSADARGSSTPFPAAAERRLVDGRAVTSEPGQPAHQAAGSLAPTGLSDRRCAACGRDLSTLPPSRTGQRRKTCDDACRQAYHRGQRAPISGELYVERGLTLAQVGDELGITKGAASRWLERFGITARRSGPRREAVA